MRLRWLTRLLPGRMFVIVDVHVQCHKLSKCLEYAALPIVCYRHKESLKSFDNRRTATKFGFLSVAILPHCAESDPKPDSLTYAPITNG